MIIIIITRIIIIIIINYCSCCSIPFLRSGCRVAGRSASPLASGRHDRSQSHGVAGKGCCVNATDDIRNKDV